MIWTCGHEHRSREEALRCQSMIDFSLDESEAVRRARYDELVARIASDRPIVDRYREADR